MPDIRFRPIAIVGLGNVFPKATGVEAFWEQLLGGRTAIRDLGETQALPGWYYDADPESPDRTYCKHAALLEDLKLDYRKYRIPPKTFQDMHRTQLAFLDATSQALEDARTLMAGIAPERVSFVLGSLGGGLRPDTRVRTRLLDMERCLSESRSLTALGAGVAAEVRAAVVQQLESEMAGLTEDEAIASFSSVWVGRAAKIFNIRGPHTTVDAGYASSLAAIQTASHQLNSGDCDVALAGGCSQLLTPHDLVAFSKLGGLAVSSLTPFDQRANGTLLGEGVGIFVLRRLDDAVAAGEKIHAVIRGVGAASDGKGKSLLAPNTRGQVLAMRRAYEQAGYGPEDVQYVECHATGTALGDLTEIASLKEVFGRQQAAGSVMLGGVKELTGHLQAAAGAAGLMKATLALSHRFLPPQHSFQAPARGIEFEGTPFYISKQGRPWPAVASGPRRAGVSAFSFGGISYHLTLEEHAPEYHSALARTLPVFESAEPIAIVGLGGVFPEASSPEALWRNLLDKRCAIAGIPPERAPIARYLDPTRTSKVRPYTDLAGSIVDGSWPQERIRVPPKVSSQIDRGHSWCMKAALQALDDAGYTPGAVDPRRVGVVMGYLPPLEREFQTQARVYYAEFDGRLAAHLRKRGLDEATVARIRGETEARYKSELPPITEDTLLGYLGSLSSSRIAHHLDFQGPALMVESACASSLVAVDVAMHQLRTGACDMMLAGGMYASLGVDALSQCCSFGGLSQTGSFPFDARADGYISSEGASLLVLKRLSDARAAGDRIYAVIRAVAGATDPKNASIWAPGVEGQVQAVRRAVEKAGVSASDIQYVEGHGTGTPVGDPIEVETYQTVYGEAARGGKIFLGSIKSNIGHLNSGAGAAALTKVALALHRKQIPPNLGFERPNPRIPWDRIPFRVPTEVEPWDVPAHGVRRAGVSSFGLGGTSFHAIVEECPPHAARVTGVEPERPPFLHLCGDSAADILQQVDGLLQRLEREPHLDVRKPLERTQAPCRFAMTLPKGQPVSKALERARRLLSGTGSPSLPEQGLFYYDTRDPRQLHAGKVAVVFPGQGPQYVNMLRELAAEYPVVARTLAEADAAFETIAGRRLSDTFWAPPGTESTHRQDDDTAHAAVFLANVALFRLIRSWGIRVDVLLGQSAGEYASLVASGMLSFEQALRAIYQRTLTVTRLPMASPGLMASISGDFDRLEGVLREAPGYATVAARNAPGQGIVAGETSAVEYVLRWCAANGFEARALPVSHAYHTQLIAKAVPPFRAELERLTWNAPQLPVLSSVHGRYYPSEVQPHIMARHLALQYVLPLQFSQHVQQLHDDGVRIFIESGPKWSLTAFIQATLKGRPYMAQASTHPKTGETEQFHRLLAFSHVHHLLSGEVSTHGA
ncbi:beta-ketoacyl synthase N-terminal-like domain-containing protein [Corallococcus sp. bb12-1]|uniref:beta-ketoacyl synthase N-terminal-like domain-containing protein n=1 Tax=Corallococcus sp. bb12-1 TaxID=2996784 RepID=UPI00226DEFCB|nr:beta-ketoacyl synthase N-terminal-like domain-containing protein [Corallococcus sp. bb12-1]MCY1042210.1 beta-ketoacyl synthase N-terminal-like domain-containing protein [Corallococcus sp. bb12-1]